MLKHRSSAYKKRLQVRVCNCYKTRKDIDGLLEGLCTIEHAVEVSFLWRPTLKDPTDEMVLEAAVNGRANYIISFNDQDYKGIEVFGLRALRPGPAWIIWKGA